MIIRKGEPEVDRGIEWRAAEFGPFESHRYSDGGGLKQYGVYLETLQPGSRSSDRHWHEKEDEFLFMIAGAATVIENDGAHVLHPGDAACWPAGTPNAHQVVNQSNAPCTYLIVGTRVTHDVCHYPDTGRVLHTEGETWRIVSTDGTFIKGGKVKA